MVQYLEVPKSPMFYSSNMSYSYHNDNANNELHHSNSARNARDASSNVTQRSNSDFALPRVYQAPSQFQSGPSSRVSQRSQQLQGLQQFNQKQPINSTPKSHTQSGFSMFSPETTHKLTYNIRLEHIGTVEVLQIILAEILGTAMLLFVGCAPFGFVMPWSFGFAVTAALQTFGGISACHINPAVTFAAFIMGEVKNPILLLVYLLSQFAGGFLGYTLHWYIVLSSFPDKEAMCVTKPPPHMNDIQTLSLETICTFIFVISICAVWDKRNMHTGDTASIKFGLILTGLIFAMYDVIPISLNTARSLPPAVFNRDFEGHWIYWVGPNIGGLLAGAVYRVLLLDRPWAPAADDTQ